MPNLTDTQRILLSTASQRQSGSLLPLPISLKPGGGVRKAIDVLVARGFVEEHETSDPTAVRRVDSDLRLGVFVTASGLTAIGIDPQDSAAGNDGSASVAAPAAATRTNKTAVVLDLLSRPDGATVAELIAATGWLPHTTRAALTGLRKKGNAIERGKRDEATCYRIVAAG